MAAVANRFSVRLTLTWSGAFDLPAMVTQPTMMSTGHSAEMRSAQCGVQYRDGPITAPINSEAMATSRRPVRDPRRRPERCRRRCR